MILAASLFLVAVATLMFLGWGWAFVRLLRLERRSWPSTVALGMAAVVFIGGVLNLLRLAGPPALTAIAILGVLLAVFALREGVAFSRPHWIVVLLIAAVMVFTIATQLPPSIYNFHDDYQKYFAYPVRMVETGTVFGSSLSAIGLQTLGAQAFLDGFVVAFFPIRFINAADAVFGLFLCLVLAAQFAQRLWITVVSVLSVVVINPQYVNISALFCGSALIMALVAAEDSASVGLMYAALIAMKPIFAVFVAIHLLAVAFVANRGFRWAVRTGLAAALFLSPWALLHAPNYLAGLRAHRPAPTPIAGDIDTDAVNLFSFEPLEYGSTAANYTALVIAIAVCGLMYWKTKPAANKVGACCITGVATFLVFVYVLGPMQYGYQHGLRYFVPVAIGLAPAIFAWTALGEKRFWLPLIVAAVPLAAFGPSFGSRIATAWRTHSAASFSWLVNDPDYLAYNQRVLTGPEHQDVKALQDRIPAGEPILAWMNTPFYLDYRRNRIIDIDTAGIGVPWAALPPARYLIWDYGGFATADQDEYEGRALNSGAGERKDSLLSLDFMRHLTALVEKGEVLYDDGELEVVRLQESARNLR
jgi:hypothetical protein